jgi:sec-independent protein translocase protein TatA
MNLGMTEILLVLGIALLFFGPSRLPGLGKSLGESIRGFKKAMEDKDSNNNGAPSSEQLTEKSQQANESSELKSKADKEKVQS